MENGFAVAGDLMSAASLLGIAGLIALYGYDGVLHSVQFLFAWLVVLLLVAEFVRNRGRFTLADVVAARPRAPAVRVALGASSATVSAVYLVAQMAGAGSIVTLLVGRTGAAETRTVLGVRVLMIVSVCCGGMRATTWLQIVKTALLTGGAVAGARDLCSALRRAPHAAVPPSRDGERRGRRHGSGGGRPGAARQGPQRRLARGARLRRGGTADPPALL